MVSSKFMRGLVFLSAMALSVNAVADVHGGFVTAEGTRLKLNGGDFYFSGANSYSMIYSELDAEQQFEAAAELGLNAIRLWGFWNGETLDPQLDEEGNVVRPGTPQTDIYGHYVLQANPREYVEQGFKRLDYVIYLAHVYNIKLIIPLLNEWPEFGGIDQLLRWTGVDFGDPPESGGHCATELWIKSFREQFWYNEEAKDIYFDYVEYVLNRVNTFTGVAYKDDPAIMIWEIMNEPRHGDWESDPTRGVVIRDFIAEAAGFIKSIDPNHLVSAGEEGFLHQEDSTGLRASYPWSCAAGEGLDWVANAEVADIDILSIHAWPFQWALWGNGEADLDAPLPDAEYPDLSTFIPDWVEEHLRLADLIDKPLYLGEFGFQILRREGSDVAERDMILGPAYDYLATTDIAGVAYWNITASHNMEAFTYQGPIERKSRVQGWFSDEAVPHDIDFKFDILCPEDATTCKMIEDYTKHMVAKVENPDPPFDVPCVAPRTQCGAACILLDSHPDHCGECGNICGDNERCMDRECTALATEATETETSDAGCNVAPSPASHSLISLITQII